MNIDVASVSLRSLFASEAQGHLFTTQDESIWVLLTLQCLRVRWRVGLIYSY